MSREKRPTGYSRDYYATNKDALTAYQRAYYAANKTKKKAQAKARYDANKQKHLSRSRAQYMRDADAGIRRRSSYPLPTRALPAVCECCGRSAASRRLALDHCHVERKFRGWLCGRCNVGIGMLGDDLAGVLRAVEYLRRAEGAS